MTRDGRLRFTGDRLRATWAVRDKCTGCGSILEFDLAQIRQAVDRRWRYLTLRATRASTRYSSPN